MAKPEHWAFGIGKEATWGTGWRPRHTSGHGEHSPGR